MKSFSIISILIVLAAGGMLWQKTLVKTKSDLLPLPVVVTPANNNQVEAVSDDNCDQGFQDTDTAECSAAVETSEQDEMAQQNSEGQAIMMKSYNEKLEKYNRQIGGRP